MSSEARALGDWRFVVRTGIALAVANMRYWTSVAPIVRAELHRWQARAGAITDPDLRALARKKLHDEGFHAEAAAMLATLAPRVHRRTVVEAIVALELLYDYLDGLTERASDDPFRDGERLFAAYIEAVAPPLRRSDRERCDDSQLEDGGYLQALSGNVQTALAQLPSADAVTAIAKRNAERSAQAQIRMHAAGVLGVAQLEEWATDEAEGTGLRWRELLAGAASSVLGVHALIASAADASTTSDEAAELEAAYLSICLLPTLLDGLVDREEDAPAGGREHLGYLSVYEDPDELARVLREGARRAVSQARRLPNGAHHVMLLVGVVGYYGSALGASRATVQPILAGLRAELWPLLPPTLTVMHAWRAARRLRSRLSRPASGTA
jgi:tetraprenyl-beta-curcumene synthase